MFLCIGVTWCRGCFCVQRVKDDIDPEALLDE